MHINSRTHTRAHSSECKEAKAKKMKKQKPKQKTVQKKRI